MDYNAGGGGGRVGGGGGVETSYIPKKLNRRLCKLPATG